MSELDSKAISFPEFPSPKRERFNKYLPLLVLFLSLAATYALWFVSHRDTENESEEFFNARVREVVNNTAQRLKVYEEVLRGAQGLFKASTSVKRNEFKDYISMLKLADNFPGIQGVGYAIVIPPEEKERHETAIRNEGFSEYSIKPEGERDVFTSIIYLEPLVERNLRAFGYDMYSEPVRRAAMDRARDTADTAMSGKVLLVQESKQNIQAGFLIYVPVYRNKLPHYTLAQRRENLVGWVYAPFRTADLIRGIYGSHTLDFNIHLYDGSNISDQALMYSSSNPFIKNESLKPRFSATRRLEIAGHQWTAVITSRPSFESKIADPHPTWVAIGGVLISVMLTVILWTLLNSRQRAFLFAQQVNHELILSEKALRESESTVQATLDSTAVAIAWANAEGEIKYANREFIKLFGYTLEDVPTVQIWYEHAYPDPDYRQKVVGKWERDIVTANEQGTEIPPIELDITCKDGSIRHVILTSAWVGTNILASFSDITERKQNEKKLQLWANIFEHAEWGIAVGSVDGKHMELANPAFAESHGYTTEEVLQKPIDELFAPGERQKLPHFVREAHEKGHCTFESEHIRKDGTTFPVLLDITAVKDDEGQVLYRIVNVQDITERRQAVKALQDSRTMLQAILDNLPYLVWMKDEDGRFIVVNKAFLATTSKVRPEDVLGKTDHDLWPGPLADKYRRDDEAVILQGGQLTLEEQALEENRMIWTETYKSPVLDEKGHLLGVTGFARDITERKQEEIRIRHQAHHDALTGLPNRTLLYDRLQHALTQAKREGEELAVLFIDLDQFKPVNDTFGHDVGDLLLKEVASRLRSCIRESDTVARIGGDEFCILLSTVESDEPDQNVTKVAEKISHTLQQPYELLDTQIDIAMSIGIAIYPKDGKDEQTLIKNADIAMYFAKKTGYGNICFFSSMDAKLISEPQGV